MILRCLVLRAEILKSTNTSNFLLLYLYTAMKIILPQILVLLLLLLLGCQPRQQKVYYPNIERFQATPNKKIITLNHLQHTDSLFSILTTTDSIPVLEIITSTKKHYFVLPRRPLECSSHLLKLRNSLFITESAVEKHKKLPLTSLHKALERDLLNNGQDLDYATSSKQLTLYLYVPLPQLATVLVDIGDAFKTIEASQQNKLDLQIIPTQRDYRLPPPL